ncbi:MAG: hypothetical protein M1833_000483 [Piccolia ochrophora]|nr:MAG: hypothetical protein M1833_000483 [Piccolia ochrophora]
MVVQNDMFTLAGRLASFNGPAQAVNKRRSSTLKSRKASKWPHASPSPAQLAKAGFYFSPTTSAPDNTICYLCERSVDGWEKDDDPTAEHLRLSKSCGWATIQCIAQKDDESKRNGEHPLCESLVLARRATFADRWPHEGKKGWACKTEKLVDAGWYFCPTPESEDLTSCAYCDLSLDGWEPKDKPLWVISGIPGEVLCLTKCREEHRRRFPECPFFTLINQAPIAPKPAASNRKPRSSRVSRASGHSNQSMVDMISQSDQSADEDVSMMSNVTATSNASAVSKAGKRGARPKKASTGSRGRKKAASMGKKTRTSREVYDDVDETNHSTTYTASSNPNKSDEGDEVISVPPTEVPQTSTTASSGKSGGRTQKSTQRKTRAKTGQQSNDGHVVEPELGSFDVEIEQSKPTKVTRGKGRTSKDTSKDTIMRDAQGQLGEEESAGLDSHNVPRNKTAPRGRKRDTSTVDQEKTREAVQQPSEDTDMLDSTVQGTRGEKRDSDKITSQAISQVLGSKTSPRMKEGKSVMCRTSGARKSGQSEPGNEHMTRGRKRASDEMSKDNVTAQSRTATHTMEDEEPPLKRRLANSKKITTIGQGTANAKGEDYQAQHKMEIDTVSCVLTRKISSNAHGSPVSKVSGSDVQERSVPNRRISNIRKGAKATVVKEVKPLKIGMTPSPSPQSSDAENQPPSSRPSTNMANSSSQRSLVPLAVSTPTGSPSKRYNAATNRVPSTFPWSAVDLEAVFLQSPSSNTNGDKENMSAATISGIVKGFRGSLSSPEQRMNVEEWIQHNAQLGEEKLRTECERIVGVFEREGNRALQVLEGIEVVR